MMRGFYENYYGIFQTVSISINEIVEIMNLITFISANVSNVMKFISVVI